MPPISQAEAQAQRAEQLRRRVALVASELEPDETVLDHSIARLERTACGKVQIEGFLVATDRKLVFRAESFTRPIPYSEVGSVNVKRKVGTRMLQLSLLDELVEFNIGKTFAESLQAIIRERRT